VSKPVAEGVGGEDLAGRSGGHEALDVIQRPIRSHVLAGGRGTGARFEGGRIGGRSSVM